VLKSAPRIRWCSIWNTRRSTATTRSAHTVSAGGQLPQHARKLVGGHFNRHPASLHPCLDQSALDGRHAKACAVRRDEPGTHRPPAYRSGWSIAPYAARPACATARSAGASSSSTVVIGKPSRFTSRETMAGLSHIGVTPMSPNLAANGVLAKVTSRACLNAAMVSGRHACTRHSHPLNERGGVAIRARARQ